METPNLCLVVANGGLSKLNRIELSRIEPDLHGRWLTAQFAALATGRDMPETFEKPSEEDWRIFLKGWREADGGTTPAMQAYLRSNEEDPGLYCEGTIGFVRRVIADTTPSGLRILADYTASLAL
ncbi:hypothetical protein [Roseovarius confluentis]|uniref:hypothetical protein n=1 Tax=Roseovarius confluentis TaxID=1852027 RepID=UPI000CDDAA56|nr:hypothetical protein [Roseovarius confluentis]